MRINRQIRAHKVRVISKDGKQVGILTLADAQKLADEDELDLVEIAPNASPPVCKIIDYGKYKY
ncbi:MAG: Translation initiation factor IF-3, partial [Candidatus Anoxychlamydiales bacterium]|nr:Translation initiation factor IF-3 [Candidatus Anoxychlamydiales bacterium]